MAITLEISLPLQSIVFVFGSALKQTAKVTRPAAVGEDGQASGGWQTYREREINKQGGTREM